MAVQEVIMTSVGVINDAKLDADLRANCPHYAGFSRRPTIEGIVLVFDTPVDSAEIATGQGVVTAHDPQALTPEQQMLANIRSVAQSAVGVALTDLTAAQQRSLLAVLLWKIGAVANDGTVNPLGEWAR